MRDPGYHPVHAYKESGAARIGRVRRQGAARQRGLRERWRAEGRPEPGTLDRAIADALRDAVLATVVDGRTAPTVRIEDVTRRIGAALVDRSRRAYEEGRDVVLYDREAVADAIWKRLLQPPKSAVTP